MRFFCPTSKAQDPAAKIQKRVDKLLKQRAGTPWWLGLRGAPSQIDRMRWLVIDPINPEIASKSKHCPALLHRLLKLSEFSYSREWLAKKVGPSVLFMILMPQHALGQLCSGSDESRDRILESARQSTLFQNEKGELLLTQLETFIKSIDINSPYNIRPLNTKLIEESFYSSPPAWRELSKTNLKLKPLIRDLKSDNGRYVGGRRFALKSLSQSCFPPEELAKSNDCGELLYSLLRITLAWEFTDVRLSLPLLNPVDKHNSEIFPRQAEIALWRVLSSATPECRKRMHNALRTYVQEKANPLIWTPLVTLMRLEKMVDHLERNPALTANSQSKVLPQESMCMRY